MIKLVADQQGIHASGHEHEPPPLSITSTTPTSSELLQQQQQPLYAWTPNRFYNHGLSAYSNISVMKPIPSQQQPHKLVLFTPKLSNRKRPSAKQWEEADTMDTNGDDDDGDGDSNGGDDDSLVYGSLNRKIVPRKYQDELFNQCKRGNVIAVAPTGAGKTLIALLVMQHALRTNPSKKVIFIVNKIPLVIQQGKTFQNDLQEPFCNRVGMFYSDKSMTNWNDVLQQYDVIVCTVQLLLNALAKPDADLSQVQLLIFDECHHAKANHPYRVLMKKFYFPVKKTNGPVPRILGLSASPAANNTTSETLLNILQLCHDLDCKIRKVEKNEEELNEVINLPFLQQRETAMDEESIHLRRMLSVAMHRIKNMMVAEMSDSQISDAEVNMDDNDSDDDLSSESISSWIQNVLQGTDKQSEAGVELEVENIFLNINEIEQMCKTRVGRLSLFGRMLNVLTECLIINDDRSCYSAWQQLLEFQNQLKLSKNEFLLKAWKRSGISDVGIYLESLPKNCQKRFQLLELLNEKKNVGDFRALLFVKTRLGASELKQFLEERNGDFIRVDVILGHGTVKRIPGMSASKQRQILDDFKSGKINVLIATSVAEEGVDVPSCRLVIRMDGIDSALQLIQSRGRARSKDSEFFCIFHKQSRDASKLKRCIVQEQKMSRAISMLIHCEQFCDDVYKHRLHLTNNHEDYTMNMSHIWEILWHYEKACDLQDELLEMVFEKYKDNLSNILTASIEKMLGVPPEVCTEKDPATDKFLGFVSIPIVNEHPNITNAYQAATRQLIYADTVTNKAQEARSRAVLRTVQVLKDKDLIIFPSSSWIGATKPKSEEHLGCGESEPGPPPKKKKKTTTSGRLEIEDFDRYMSLDNAISVLQHHCIKSFDKKIPAYKDVVEEGRNHFCLCVLPDNKASVKSDGFTKKKDAKKHAALKMCEFIVKRDGFMHIPSSILESLPST